MNEIAAYGIVLTRVVRWNRVDAVVALIVSRRQRKRAHMEMRYGYGVRAEYSQLLPSN